MHLAGAEMHTENLRPEPLEMVLFDYGGVLLRLNDPLALFGVNETLPAFNARWISSAAVAAYESGRIDSVAFARGVIDELGLPYGEQEFIARFDRWPDCVSPETAALVQRIPRPLTCAILSNTNPLHWRTTNIGGIFNGRIDRCFLSFETGLVKPDAAAFAHVITAADCDAAAILFIDDNPVNIKAATASGMRACLCPGVEHLAGILVREGVLDAWP